MTANPKLATIRKILALAESESELGHVEAAELHRNKAIALMVAHGIDEAMVAAAEHKNEVPEQRVYSIDNPYRVDKQVLLQWIAQPLGCKSVRIPKSTRVHLVGFPSDLDRVELLWTSLLLQVFGEVVKASGYVISPDWNYLTSAERRAARVSYTKSFFVGFGTVVCQRLVAATEQARQDYETDHGTSTALVVVDRTKKVESTFDELHPNVRKGFRRKVSNGTAYNRGGQAGERADIGATRVGGLRKQIS